MKHLRSLVFAIILVLVISTCACGDGQSVKIVSESGANVRQKPSQDSEKVGRVYTDEIYQLLEISKSNWYKIRLNDGTIGWISGKLAEIVETSDESSVSFDDIDLLYFERAVVVAATNSQATDVFKSDGNTIDKDKLHHYSDVNGFYLTMRSEGEWSDYEKNSWRVEGMILRIPGYNTYMSVWCNVTYVNNQFKITDLKKIISSTMEFDDPNKTSVIKESDNEIYLTVPFSFVENGRENENSIEESTNSNKKESEFESEKYKEWVSVQFSVWDGSNSAFIKLIKKHLNDEKSFKHISTDFIMITTQEMKDYLNSALKETGYSYQVDLGDLFITTEFSAKNAYNATVKANAYGISRYSDNSLILLSIE